MSFVGWKAFRLLAPDKHVLVGGINHKLFRDPKTHKVTRCINKPFFYFGPVVHRAALPTPTNLHGLWSFTSLNELRQQGYIKLFDIIAKVRVFGTVLEYENVYRSSSIAFDELYVPPTSRIPDIPVLRMALETRYQCDVRHSLPPLE